MDEHLHELLAPRELGQDALDDEDLLEALDAVALGLEDLRHAALPEPLEQAIATERGVHRAEFPCRDTPASGERFRPPLVGELSATSRREALRAPRLRAAGGGPGRRGAGGRTPGGGGGGAAHHVHGIREAHRRYGHERQDVVHAAVAAHDDLDPAVVRSDGDVEIAIDADRAVLRLGERAGLGSDLRRSRRDIERLDHLVAAADLPHDDVDRGDVDPRGRADAKVTMDRVRRSSRPRRRGARRRGRTR